MKRYIPTMYQKSIFDISYSKLKKRGIKCLIFDLDNTLALIDEKKCPEKTKQLCERLKKEFQVVIISNNTKKRLLPYLEELQVDGVSMALKPSIRGLKKIQKKYRLRKEEMVMIGDQLMTDIVSGNRFHIMTILVDPLGKKDLKITGINRFFENRVLKKLSQLKILERGTYYE